QRRAGVGRDSKAYAAHLLVDQASEIALVVDVTGDCDGALRLFADGAQRRVALEIACLDDDAAIDRRRRNQCFDGWGDVAAASLHPDRAPAAEQGDRIRLVGQARWIAEIVAF